MSLSYAHGREFVSQIRPFLETHDAPALVRFLSEYWPNPSLIELLTCGHTDAVKCALVGLSLTGRVAESPRVAALLHARNRDVSALAEYALWAMWFREGDEAARGEVGCAIRLISAGRLDEAVRVLDAVLQRCPRLAEAYNQRAIAYFLKEDYRRSLADCRRTLRLNACHFGAMAGIGHCCTALGLLKEALAAYRRALRINPRMQGIRASMREIRASLRHGWRTPKPQTHGSQELPPRA